MIIIWHGQSCFEMLSSQGKNNHVNIVVDPFDEATGLRVPKLEADILLVTHCFDEKTEILTDKGWKYFYELNGDEKIATLSKEGYLEYQKPSKIINYPYKGLMYRLQTHYIDLLTTPEHRLFVKRKIKKDYELIEAKKLIGVYKTFKKNAKWKGKKIKHFLLPEYSFFSKGRKTKKIFPERRIEMDKFLKFLGFFISEGYVDKYHITLAQDAKSPFFKEIVNSIKEINFEPKIFQSNNNQIRIDSVQLANFLLSYQKPKRIPFFIKELSSRQIKIFLETFFKGDGSFKNNRFLRCSSKEKALVDNIQELLLKVGLAGHIKEILPRPFIDGDKIYGGESPQYCLNVFREKVEIRDRHRSLGPMGNFFEGYINYIGTVGCVTVPNGVIYVRRNGKPVWCGNCHHDHNNVKAVSGNPFLIQGAGEYEAKGVYIQGVDSAHDASQGKERGQNTIYTIEVEDLRICHLGDLGQKELTPEQVEKIGEVDILMIPVGGVYTISAKEAVKIMSQIEPNIVIPMHYQIPKLRIGLEGLDKFLKTMGIKKIESLPKLSIKKKDISSEEAKIIVLKP